MLCIPTLNFSMDCDFLKVKKASIGHSFSCVLYLPGEWQERTAIDCDRISLHRACFSSLHMTIFRLRENKEVVQCHSASK